MVEYINKIKKKIKDPNLKNKKGQVVFLGFMIGIVILVLALGLAGLTKNRTDTVMNASSITYAYYGDLRNWDVGSVEQTINETIIFNQSRVIYQVFNIPATIPLEYVMLENITFRGNKVGSPTGNITLTLIDGITPYEEHARTLTTTTRQLSDFSATPNSMLTLNFPPSPLFQSVHSSYIMLINVSNTDGSNYVNLSKNNYLLDLWAGGLYLVNTTDNSSSVYINDTADIVFNISVRSGGIEVEGLDCDNESISNFNRSACIVTDLTLFYFIGGLIFIAGIIIVARLVIRGGD